ncbi:Sec-independent protein translocase protein TatB [Gordonia otitidis]|uniref:Sec-independent protein translocase protein TatB n=1 Tax=Gordonia otitidis (strain DSM 44809 / CCUG 52243 / JCM 12355 / NBRC 100426 / IFM 10032) TaxID=1108044 RepID=H5TK51_GORO1|nr:Sec-independent protein translocase protein TatB [Gordonia otitidis]UEA59590.1 Sec-independent protein translocase protein TatB [Gordonia otitidis]GAB33859.1 Sec-independent protein translocase protein TatB [Gordonia otitidis NBRC 100426]
MFSSVGWGEVLILLVAALVILGPERLPGAVSWTMQSLRKAREYATGATDQLKNDFGPEFDELRKPLSQLNELRGMTPQSIVTKHLFDGDSSIFTSGPSSNTVERDGQTPPIKPVSAPMPVPTDDPVSGTTTQSTGRKHDVSDWDAT